MLYSKYSSDSCRTALLAVAATPRLTPLVEVCGEQLAGQDLLVHPQRGHQVVVVQPLVEIGEVGVEQVVDLRPA